MKLHATVVAGVVTAAFSLPAQADPPRPGCEEDVARQSVLGGVSAFVPGGEHTPGPHFSGDATGRAVVPAGQVGMAIGGSAMAAALQSSLPDTWHDKALASFVAFGWASSPLGPEASLAAGSYGAVQSAIGSAADYLAEGHSGLAIAKRATINGVGNGALAGLVVWGATATGALVGVAVMPVALAAGGFAAAVTVVTALPAWFDCPPDRPQTAAPPTLPPTCAAGQESVRELKFKLETARQSGKSFEYRQSQNAMGDLLAHVSATCERETATTTALKPGKTCAEQKEILSNFRQTVETACRTDRAWCSQAQPALTAVIARTSDICERERVAGDSRRPRSPSARKRAPQPVYVRPRPPPGPSPEDIAAAAAIGAGIAAAMGRRSRGPVYQPSMPPPQRCHRSPTGQIHCGRN